MKNLALDQLRALLQTQTKREFLPCSFLQSGLPRGAITEVSGFGKTELIVNLLAEHSELRVAWIEGCFSVFPFGFAQRHIDLDRILFVEAGSELTWSALQVLKSGIFSIVVLYTEQMNIGELRRIQLASEKAHASTLWLTSHPQSLWPINLQLQVQTVDGEINVNVSRQRF